MSRADGKLYELMTDEVCHGLLRQLLASTEALTQRALVAALPYDSSTVSRRMRDLEELGLVRRASGHAPYELLFPQETRDLLEAGTALGHVAHALQAAELARDLEQLKETGRGTASAGQRNGRSS